MNMPTPRVAVRWNEVRRWLRLWVWGCTGGTAMVSNCLWAGPQRPTAVPNAARFPACLLACAAALPPGTGSKHLLSGAVPRDPVARSLCTAASEPPCAAASP